MLSSKIQQKGKIVKQKFNGNFKRNIQFIKNQYFFFIFLIKKSIFILNKKALKRKIPANKIQGITISKTSP